VIFPLYGESACHTTLQLVGAGFTLSVRHISRLAPRPWGTPYIWPSTELCGLFFSPSKTPS
jgi:hypothetical protein